jgi:hypothetical protein
VYFIIFVSEVNNTYIYIYIYIYTHTHTHTFLLSHNWIASVKLNQIRLIQEGRAWAGLILLGTGTSNCPCIDSDEIVGSNNARKFETISGLCSRVLVGWLGSVTCDYLVQLVQSPGYRLDDRGSNPGRGKIFIFSKTIKIGSGVHPAPFSVGTGVLFLR